MECTVKYLKINEDEKDLENLLSSRNWLKFVNFKNGRDVVSIIFNASHVHYRVVQRIHAQNIGMNIPDMLFFCGAGMIKSPEYHGPVSQRMDVFFKSKTCVKKIGRDRPEEDNVQREILTSISNYCSSLKADREFHIVK